MCGRLAITDAVRCAATLILLAACGATGAAAQEDDPSTHGWVTAGGGLGTAGFGGVLGATVERSGWTGSVRFHTAKRGWSSGSPTMTDKLVEEYAFLVGRTLEGADVAVGVSHMSQWEQRKVACSTGLCLSDTQLVSSPRTSSLGLAFDITFRKLDRGAVGAGLQLLGRVGQTGSYVNAAVLMEVGRLR